MNYVKNLKSGIINGIQAIDFDDAKKEATRQASYDGGDLLLYFDGKHYYAELCRVSNGDGTYTFWWEWL